ncbi:hypothetical protein [Pseudogracilibacillus sp. SO30301A]|uniref:hypothetical protein n=1 Tax=Pseudogracilibacillus sp. SO30301A TaxID=3098291 RepID=UPI00300E1C6B
MNLFYYNPEVRFLLINQSSERVEVLYNESAKAFELPLIGPRPPYYAYPIYQEYYPII